NAASMEASVPEVSSKNTADFPAGSEEMPSRGTALPAELELSSIFQPVRSTAAGPVLVSSNQSAAYGAFPLAHGATSEMIIPAPVVPAGVMVSVKVVVASGVGPTVGSSTVTVTV